MLIGVAAVLLIGVVVLVVMHGPEPEPRHRAAVSVIPCEIHTSRPEELVSRGYPNDRFGRAPTITQKPQIRRPTCEPHPRWHRRARRGHGRGQGARSDSDEIEDMARKRSERHPALLHARADGGRRRSRSRELKKIQVTMTVDKSGAVSDVQLSDARRTDTLGQCLIEADQALEVPRVAGRAVSESCWRSRARFALAGRMRRSVPEAVHDVREDRRGLGDVVERGVVGEREPHHAVALG